MYPATMSPANEQGQVRDANDHTSAPVLLPAERVALYRMPPFSLSIDDYTKREPDAIERQTLRSGYFFLGWRNLIMRLKRLCFFRFSAFGSSEEVEENISAHTTLSSLFIYTNDTLRDYRLYIAYLIIILYASGDVCTTNKPTNKLIHSTIFRCCTR